MGGLLFSLAILLSSCQNFFNENNLKQQIEEKIKIANASSVPILVSVRDNIYGIIQQEGSNTIKEGVPFKLNFSIDGDYVLDKWVAYISGTDPTDVNNQLDETYVSFTNPVSEASSESITVIVHKLISGKTIVISPLCIRRPYVVSFSDDGKSVYYKNPVWIKFNEEVSLNTAMGTISYAYFTTKYEKVNFLINSEQVQVFLCSSGSSGKIDVTNTFLITFSNNNIYLQLHDAVYDTDESYAPIFKYFDEEYKENSIDISNRYYTTLKYGIAGYKYELVIHPGIESKSTKIKSSKEYTYTFYLTQSSDTAAPVYTDIRYILTDNNVVIYEGLYNNSSAQHNYLYRKDEIAQDILNLYQSSLTLYNANKPYIASSADYLACEKVREGFVNSGIYSGNVGYYPARISKNFIFYATAGDIQSEDDIIAGSSGGVKCINYAVYRITDSQGTINSSWQDPLIVYEYSPTMPYRAESQLNFIDGRFYHDPKSEGQMYKIRNLESYNIVEELLKSNGGIAVNFDLQVFPDGLYVIETSLEDWQNNRGNSSNNQSYYITSRYNDIKQWVRHNSQLWFIKDTTPPQTVAADFELPEKYWYNADTISSLSIPMDTNFFRSESRKIVDAGNICYNSLFTYRICSLNDFEEDPSGLETTGWLKTYETDYNFEEVYGTGNWIPSDFTEGKHNIYAYVKDDVNNVGSKIVLEDSFGYDNTAPVVAINQTTERDGEYLLLAFDVEEKVSGLKTIKYKLPQGTAQYMTALIGDYFESSTAIDSGAYNESTKSIILPSAEVKEFFAIVFKISDDAVLEFTFIDEAGNESSDVIYTVE